MAAILFLIALFLFPIPTHAQTVTFGISQVKTQGSAANDEFIELLNPSESAMDLSGYKLVKETASATQYTILTFGQTMILPQSYYLIAHKDGVFYAEADATYQTSLADNNRLYLLGPNGDVVDTLAWGNITGTVLPNPDKDQVIRRLWQPSTQRWSVFSVATFETAHRSGDLQVVFTEEEQDPVIPNEDEGLVVPRINELSFWPEHGDVFWIELFHPGDTVVDVSGWSVQTEGKVFVELSGSIEPNSYLVAFWPPSEELPINIHLYSDEQRLETWEISSSHVAGTSLALNEAEEIHSTSLSTAARPNIFASQAPIVCQDTPLEDEDLLPESTAATSGQVILNEVFANPEGDENTEEFIELYNNELFPIDLSDWLIADAVKLTVLQEKVIAGQSYLVLKKSDTGISLNNSDETVTLTDSSGAIVSQLSYAVTTEGLSLNRASPQWYEAAPTPGMINEQQPQTLPTTTPPPDQTPAPPPKSTTTSTRAVDANAALLRINELLPNPEGSDDTEWIELHNTGASPVSLLGLSLGDSAKTYALPDESISALGFVVVTRLNSGIALNNDKDHLRLMSGEAILDEVAYESSVEGQSWARDNDEEWTLTSHLTPGKQNVFEVIEPAPANNIEPILSQPNSEQTEVATAPLSPVTRPSVAKTVTAAGEETLSITSQGINVDFITWDQAQANDLLTIRGVIIVAPGTFTDKNAFIQGEGGEGPGLELYFSKADWPDLEVGDVVQVTGKKSSIKSGRRLLLSTVESIVVLDHIDVEPLAAENQMLSEQHHHTLVAITGELTLRGKSELIVTTEGHTYAGSIAKAKLASPNLLPNSTGTVIGLYQHGGTVTLWPRFQDDLLVDEPPLSATTANNLDLSDVASHAEDPSRWPTVLAVCGALLLGLVYYFKDPLIALTRERLLSLRNYFSV
jgi:hypothetical protein